MAMSMSADNSEEPGYVQISVNPLGRVGLWTREPMTLAHVHSDEPSRPATVHASGSTAALSFTDRKKGLTWDSGVAGERWELRSEERVARLWTPATGDVARFDHRGAVHLPGKLTCAAVEQTSSRELKCDVAPLSTRLNAKALLRELQPVTFRWRANPDSEERAGFIAEDVPQALAADDGRAVKLNDLVAVLTQVVKDQAATIERHEAELRCLRDELSNRSNMKLY
eukprot:CAMPEP_0119343054 /NCGR_PEP_ID=MMETSP1333-20130426/106030_1 /TAXON_ID=418940 /ORGANISM="Scyphosphaera apsteinii, Strain RCC1455" /LENGTH=225 /DNA_ID=CAMNT_0007355405 /DNA_START=8 /DNA_END=685 /DNA_ORIENTATION=+